MAKVACLRRLVPSRRYRHQVEGCRLANEDANGSSAQQHSLGAGWQDLFAPSRFCHLPQVRLLPVGMA